MTNLSQKFDALETQLATQEAAANTDRDLTNTRIQAVLDALDTITVNNAANTKYLLSAIGQLNSCYDCAPGTLIPPPIDETGHPIDEDRCKRAQALLRFLLSYITVQDGLSAFGVGFNTSLLVTAFNQAVTNLGSSDTPPIPSLGEIVQLAGDLLNYTGYNLTVGGSLVAYWSTIADALQTAVYAGGSAEASLDGYRSIIQASSLPSYVKAVFKDDGYLGAFNYYLDPANTVDLTGLDGTICGGGLIDSTTCVEIAAVLFHDTDGQDRYHILAAPSLEGSPSTIAGDFSGWVMDIVSGTTGKNVAFDVVTDPTHAHRGLNLHYGGTPNVLGDHGIAIVVYTDVDDGGTKPFTVRFCPPGVSP